MRKRGFSKTNAALVFFVLIVSFVIVCNNHLFSLLENEEHLAEQILPQVKNRIYPTILNSRYLSFWESVSPGMNQCREFKFGQFNKQVCCQEKDAAVGWRCFPSIVLAGVQKGGSTALQSYLLTHPQLVSSSKKELHLWDSDRKYRSSFQTLLRHWPATHAPGSKLTFESSPSYTASTMACERMSLFLPPSTTYVIILRDPVERIWSEINMKLRRIQRIDELIDIAIQRGEQLRECLTDSHAWPECLTRVIPEIDKRVKSNQQSNFKRFYERCIKNESRISIPTPEQVLKRRNCFQEEHIFHESLPDFEAKIKEEIAALQANKHCLETVRPVEEADQPLSASLRCDTSSPLVNHSAPCSFDLIKDGKTMSLSGACGTPQCQCFPLLPSFSDISRGYLWRGHYFHHIQHCLQFIPRRNLLIFENSELRKSPQSVVSQIYRHAGLMPAAVNWYDAALKFEQEYPSFEKKTGWRIEGSNQESMPPSLKKILVNHYRPFNNALFKLIGKSFPHWHQ